jgi:flagellar export protein FliJ
MKRFSFRLERVLQLREAAEREQGRALARALREEEERRAQAEASETRLAAARAQCLETPRELLQAGTLQNLELAIEALSSELRTLAQHHEASLQRVEAERHQFEQARMARRVIERLREQRRQTWGDDLSRHEQGVSDETALQRTRTNGRETP